MKVVWYIGQVINYETSSWELAGIFNTKDEALSNLNMGEFCASIEFGKKLSLDSIYPNEAYWKMEDGSIKPALSNKA